MPRAVGIFAILAPWLVALGCSSQPAAIAPPDIDPEELSTAAIKQYDNSGDGTIEGKELATAPSLRFSLDRIDANGDGKVKSDEIAEFVQKHWLNNAAGIIRVECVVYFGGRLLDGATVTFEPEEFMQGAVHPASGVTRGGTASIDVSDENRPHPNAHGVQTGFYLVRVSKIVNGKETLPPKYNVQTILGCEIARRASYMPGPVVFNL